MGECEGSEVRQRECQLAWGPLEGGADGVKGADPGI